MSTAIPRSTTDGTRLWEITYVRDRGVVLRDHRAERWRFGDLDEALMFCRGFNHYVEHGSPQHAPSFSDHGDASAWLAGAATAARYMQ